MSLATGTPSRRARRAAGPGRERYRDLHQLLLQDRRAPGMRIRQARYLLGERHRGAAVREALEPARQQIDHHGPAAERHIGEPTPIPAMCPGGSRAAPRASTPPRTRSHPQDDHRSRPLNEVNDHIGQMRQDLDQDRAHRTDLDPSAAASQDQRQSLHPYAALHSKPYPASVACHRTSSRVLPAVFARHGCSVVHVQSTTRPIALSAHDLTQYIDNIVCDDDDLTVQAIAKHQPVCVIAGQDHGVRLADVAAARLGLAGNDPATSRLRRDKYDMVEALRAAGIRCARQFRSGDPIAIVDWAEHDGSYPYVVKPLASRCSWRKQHQLWTSTATV